MGSSHPGGGSVSQEVEASVLNGLDFQVIFPSISPRGDTGLGGPLFSPYCFDEVEASESQGFDLRDMDMETDCYLNPHEKNYPPMSPLWKESIDQYDHDILSSSPLIDSSSYLFTQFHAGPSYSSNGNQLWSEGGFMDCLTHAANRSWNILLWVIKWCLRVKKAAIGYRLKKKQKIA